MKFQKTDDLIALEIANDEKVKLQRERDEQQAAIKALNEMNQ